MSYKRLGKKKHHKRRASKPLLYDVSAKLVIVYFSPMQWDKWWKLCYLCKICNEAKSRSVNTSEAISIIRPSAKNWNVSALWSQIEVQDLKVVENLIMTRKNVDTLSIYRIEFSYEFLSFFDKSMCTVWFTSSIP